MMTPAEAELVASELFTMRSKDRNRLDMISAYMKGDPRLAWLSAGAPTELQALAKMSQVNLMPLVVKSSTQQMFVDGYSSKNPQNAATVWSIWQANRWDRKQIGVHKSASTYGVAYAVVMPGTGGMPVMRPVSATDMTAAYSTDDSDWPVYALEMRDGGLWRLYDEDSAYDLRRTRGRRYDSTSGKRTAVTFELLPDGISQHDQGVTPVVRYFCEEDLDNPVKGDIEPLFTLQDQINLITFHLMVAEHYGAHGRKVIISRMVKEMEAKLVKASANTMLTINADPDQVDIQELAQTSLDGFIQSRESAIKLLSAISQTPTHELLGALGNLSAAALTETRESTDRKVDERTVVMGEAHEQLLGRAGVLAGVDLDHSARVKWKNTRTSRQGALVQMLALMAEKLGVPVEAMWEHLPFSDSDIQSIQEKADVAELAPSA